MADDPAAVFAEAQAAMGRGDWHAFFACHVARDLGLVTGHGLALVAGPDPEVRADVQALAARRGVDRARLDALVAAADAVSASAAALLSTDGLERSLRHRDLVKALDAAVRAAVRSATDIAALTADLEGYRRARFGGGGFSSSLYAGETLTDVRIDGKVAVGMRRFPRGGAEAIVFARTRDGWLIRPFARPPAALRRPTTPAAGRPTAGPCPPGRRAGTA